MCVCVGGGGIAQTCRRLEQFQGQVSNDLGCDCTLDGAKLCICVCVCVDAQVEEIEVWYMIIIV